MDCSWLMTWAEAWIENWDNCRSLTAWAMSASVRSPISVLGLSNTARTGLTGFVAGMSRQVAGKGVCVNNLLPGIHATDRADSLDGGVASAQGITVDQARAQRQATIPTGTYGTAADFGATCAFLCSQQAR